MIMEFTVRSVLFEVFVYKRPTVRGRCDKVNILDLFAVSVEAYHNARRGNSAPTSHYEVFYLVGDILYLCRYRVQKDVAVVREVNAVLHYKSAFLLGEGLCLCV